MNTHRRVFIRAIVAAMSVTVLPAAFAPPASMQQGGTYTLRPSVISSGGGSSANSTTNVTGTIGQGVLGTSTGGEFSVTAGFWQGDAPCSPPNITAQPESQTACEHSSVTLLVAAQGTNPSFQWRKNSQNISGQTSPSLTLSNLSAGDAASYDCVIGTGCGNATSNAATLTVSTFSLSSTGQVFPSTGGTSSLNVIVAGSCAWTAVSNDSWITVTGGASGAGNGTVSYSVGANSGGARTGTITAAGLIFTVSQTAPTLITLISFEAEAYTDGVFIEWRTGLEVSNLGFNLYREDNGQLTRVNSQVIAGSALRIGQVIPLGAGCSYSWWDKSPAAKSTRYWLEDLDANGGSVMHGPFGVVQGQLRSAPVAQARTLAELSAAAAPSAPLQARAASPSSLVNAAPGEVQTQARIATAANSVKLQISNEAWYRVSGRELFSAGLDRSVDPHKLQMFVDGKQQAIRVNGDNDGRFDDGDSIEFYGVGIDSPFSASRTYYLIAGQQAGLRITTVANPAHPSQSGAFPFSVERRDHTIYFAALRNGDKENFFGALVASQPVIQDLTIKNVAESSEPAFLDIGLQGVTNVPHFVTIHLNGADLGQLDFQNQQQGETRFSLPASLLKEGTNEITLTARGGSSDLSLVDHLRLTYQHRFAADDDRLRLSVSGGRQVTLTGFSAESIHVFDVTDSSAVQEVTGSLGKDESGFSISLAVQGKGTRELLAVNTDKPNSALVSADYPSNLRNPAQGADLLIITRREMFSSVEALKSLRQKQGLSVAVIDVNDIYDEFSFGQKTPQALKDFIGFVRSNWKKPMRYLLFVGDASYDPKNYFGLGDFDLVPTRLVDTSFMESASDDWLADFNGDGVADIAIGRLPVRNASEADSIINKIIVYEQSSPASEALLVSDSNDGFNFESASGQLIPLIPSIIRVTQVNRGQLGDIAARAALLDAISRGVKIVNYTGHGNVNLWRGDLLDSTDALGLRNENLAVFAIMDCLNGYFQDPAMDSLAEALLKSSGGAVAVWASSAMTFPDAQMPMNREFYRQVFTSRAKIGDAAARAKMATPDVDVRRTWILFGDPTLTLK
jgi:peptidase C25-like protein/Ig-like domain-containing protein/all-beta uncharacterized protein